MKQIEVVAAIIRDAEGRIFATQRGYGESPSILSRQHSFLTEADSQKGQI